MGHKKDRNKDKPPHVSDMKAQFFPRGRDLAGASVIQQMGLNTADGMHRFLNILITKMDPECKGVTITLEDLQKAVSVTAPAPMGQQRHNTMVLGQDDKIFIKLMDDDEYHKFVEHQKSITPVQVQ